MSSPKDILLQHFSETEIDALVEGFLEDEWKESGYDRNHVLQAMSVSIMNDAIDMHSFGDAMGGIDPNNDGDQNNQFSNTTSTRARRASSRSRASHRSTSPRSRQSSGQGGDGGSQGIPTTPKHKKKEPADYDEAVGKLSHTASGLKLDDDIMDVDNGGESGVTLSSKEGGVSIVDQQGTTNTSTTENNHQGSVAMEDGVEDNDDDVKMKDTETSRIPETPKKQANNNGDEDDTKQAAVVYAVPKIKIKEVYGTDSLTNCLTKCEHKKCKLSAVIRVEVDGKVFILCNDHLELER
jgi:hypothetical protein